MVPERPATPAPSSGGLYFCPEHQPQGGNRATSKDKLGASVKISACKTKEDIENVTEIELLNFPVLGALDDDTNEPSGLQRLSAAYRPLRLPLQEAGVSPRLWPDFKQTVARRERSLIDNKTIILKASMQEEQSGHERVVAMALLTVPPSYKAVQRNWVERIKNGIVYPAVDNVASRLCEHGDGTVQSLKELYIPELRKRRDEVLKGRDCFELEFFAVHPSCHRRGVGKVLLQHCLSMADSADVPMILESTAKGYPFYIANGFEVVSRGRVEHDGNVYEWPVMIWEPSSSQ